MNAHPLASADRPLLATAAPLPHIGFMDGLRGLAAVFVVLHHAVLRMWPFPGVALTPPYSFWLFPFKFGHFSVTLFIVLSGFLLTMPIVRKDNQLGKSLPEWTVGFFRRRALRILPPYWAALAYSIVFSAFLYDNGHIRMAMGKNSDLISHLLLLHDWGLGQSFAYNGAMWTIPIEWHIYLTVPLLILLWRRFHPVAVAASVLLVAYIINALLPLEVQGRVATYYYGIFSLGGLGAWIVFGSAPWAQAARAWRWGEIWAVGFLAVCLALATATWGQFVDHYYWFDLLFAGVAACGIVSMALQPNVPRRIFGSRFMVWLGSFSYSIYLTHVPVLEAVHRLFYRLYPKPGANPVWFLLIVGTGTALVTAYLFYLLFERPFVQLKKRDKARHGENPDAATA